MLSYNLLIPLNRNLRLNTEMNVLIKAVKGLLLQYIQVEL